MTEFIKEILLFIEDLSTGEMNILAARKKAAALQAKAPSKLTDALLADVEKEIAELREGEGD